MLLLYTHVLLLCGIVAVSFASVHTVYLFFVSELVGCPSVLTEKEVEVVACVVLLQGE